MLGIFRGLIATLNVKTLQSKDKLNELGSSMSDSGIDIIGVYKIRRAGEKCHLQEIWNLEKRWCDDITESQEITE